MSVILSGVKLEKMQSVYPPQVKLTKRPDGQFDLKTDELFNDQDRTVETASIYSSVDFATDTSYEIHSLELDEDTVLFFLVEMDIKTGEEIIYRCMRIGIKDERPDYLDEFLYAKPSDKLKLFSC